MLQLLDRSVLQLRVTAQFYLENKRKYILEAWKGSPFLQQGHADSKDVKRRESACKRASPGPSAPLFACSPPRGLPYPVFTCVSSPGARPMETGPARGAVCSA